MVGGGGVGLILINLEHHRPVRAHTVQLVNRFITIFSIDDNANGRFWHEAEEALWSANEAVSGPSFHLLFVAP
jgi:hypothetical protein